MTGAIWLISRKLGLIIRKSSIFFYFIYTFLTSLRKFFVEMIVHRVTYSALNQINE